MAYKAAPLKINGAALCILTNHEIAITKLNQIIDATIITFQLLDDWADWSEDLSIGNCSFLLSQVMKSTQIDDFSTLKESDIQKAVYGFDVLDQVFQIAEQNHELIKSQPLLQLPYLIAYHEELLLKCRNILSEIHQSSENYAQRWF